MLKTQTPDADMYKSKKIISIEEACLKIAELKRRKKTIGLCHGGFDLLHAGHIKHFESAKKLCDYLIISITSDKYVQKHKGAGRPIFPDRIRAYIISAIEFVDNVVISDHETGIDIITILKPSYYIKGPDYINKKEDIALRKETEAILSVKGKILFTKDIKLSTTEIINHIKNV